MTVVDKDFWHSWQRQVELFTLFNDPFFNQDLDIWKLCVHVREHLGKAFHHCRVPGFAVNENFPWLNLHHLLGLNLAGHIWRL